MVAQGAWIESDVDEDFRMEHDNGGGQPSAQADEPEPEPEPDSRPARDPCLETPPKRSRHL